MTAVSTAGAAALTSLAATGVQHRSTVNAVTNATIEVEGRCTGCLLYRASICSGVTSRKVLMRDGRLVKNTMASAAADNMTPAR